MKERVAAAVVAGTLLAGCAAPDSADDLRDMLSQQVTIDTYNEVPRDIPDAVEHAASAILRVHAEGSDGMPIDGSGFLASTRHGSNRLVTAGHMLDGVSAKHVMLRSKILGLSGVESEISVKFLDTGGSAMRQDVAIASPSSDVFQHGPALQTRNFSQRPLREKEPVWFINYQIGAKGNEANTSMHPTIFPAIYLGKTSATRAVVVANIDPSRTDDEFRPGGSGGAVVDNQGNAVGISVSYSLLSEPCTQETFTDVQKDGKLRMLRVGFKDNTMDECEAGLQLATITLPSPDGEFTAQ